MWRSVPDAAAAEAGPSRRFGFRRRRRAPWSRGQQTARDVIALAAAACRWARHRGGDTSASCASDASPGDFTAKTEHH